MKKLPSLRVLIIGGMVCCLFFLTLMIAGVGGSYDKELAQEIPSIDFKAQKRINRFVYKVGSALVVSLHMSIFENAINSMSQRAIKDIQSDLEMTPEELVAQILIYQGCVKEKSRDKVSISYNGIRYLRKNCSAIKLLTHVSPLIESDVPGVRVVAEDFLRFYVFEKLGAGFWERQLEQELVVPYLRQFDSPPRQLTLWLFKDTPFNAFELWCDLYIDDVAERSKIKLAAERVRQEITPILGSIDKLPDSRLILKDLRFLSEDSRWWIRLFSANVVARHWGLREMELVDQFLADSDVYISSLFRGFSKQMLYVNGQKPPIF